MDLSAVWCKRPVQMPGKSKTRRTRKIYMFMGQKYREKGMVIRYLEVGKTYKLYETCGQNGAEMTGAEETLSGVEIARTYFEPGKRSTDRLS